MKSIDVAYYYIYIDRFNLLSKTYSKIWVKQIYSVPGLSDYTEKPPPKKRVDILQRLPLTLFIQIKTSHPNGNCKWIIMSIIIDIENISENEYYLRYKRLCSWKNINK